LLKEVGLSSQHRSDVVSFLLDLLDFIGEQVECSRSEADRAAAIAAASGSIPLLKSRLWENESLGAVLALSPLEAWVLSPFWQENWNNLAKTPSDQFGKAADEFVEALHMGKEAILQMINWQERNSND
jgi:hypothetical protein